MTFRVAERWFEHRGVGDGVSLIWEPHVDPFARCNMWHVRGRDRDLLIDTGLGVSALRPYVEDVFGRSVTAVLTHVHFDHSGGFHEFDQRVMHPAEAGEMRDGLGFASLTRAGFPPDVLRALEDSGYTLKQRLIEAMPYAGFDPARYAVTPAEPTALIGEGDAIDLGDRRFEVLHVPGHSPGSIGLFERASGTLFSGDTVYDGPLLDRLPGSDRAAYAESLERLMGLPVEVVHAGHDPSFDRTRLLELCTAYVNACRV